MVTRTPPGFSTQNMWSSNYCVCKVQIRAMCQDYSILRGIKIVLARVLRKCSTYDQPPCHYGRCGWQCYQGAFHSLRFCNNLRVACQHFGRTKCIWKMRLLQVHKHFFRASTAVSSLYLFGPLQIVNTSLGNRPAANQLASCDPRNWPMYTSLEIVGSSHNTCSGTKIQSCRNSVHKEWMDDDHSRREMTIRLMRTKEISSHLKIPRLLTTHYAYANNSLYQINTYTPHQSLNLKYYCAKNRTTTAPAATRTNFKVCNTSASSLLLRCSQYTYVQNVIKLIFRMQLLMMRLGRRNTTGVWNKKWHGPHFSEMTSKYSQYDVNR